MQEKLTIRNTMKKQIFIINGSGGVGKDAFVSCIETQIPHPIMNFSSVDKIKSIAKIMGWNGDKSEKSRKFLSDLKSLCSEYNDSPFISMREKVEEFIAGDAMLLFLHIREPIEIERAKREFNAKSILVKRDSVARITTNEADRNVDEYNYDIVIYNNSDLYHLDDIASRFIDDYQKNRIQRFYE